MFTSAMIRSV